jgi:hypothetical protein
MSNQSFESVIARSSVDVDNLNRFLNGFTFIFLLHRSSVYHLNRLLNVFPLSLFFFGIETLGRTSASTTFLRVDDLVKGFLTFVLASRVGEEKCNFIPFLDVTLVDEGTSYSGAGGGEKSLCRE